MIKLVTVIEQHEEHHHSRGGYHRIEPKPHIQSPAQPHKDLAQSALNLRNMLGRGNAETLIDPEVTFGKVAETILKLAQDWHADLIVVGTHGRNELEKFFLGSVSTAVLQHSKSHVLVARSSPESMNREVYRVLVPVDHSPFSRAAIEWLMRQRWSKPVEIRLLNAQPELSQLSAQFAAESDTERAADILTEIQMQEAKPLEILDTLAAEIGKQTNFTSIGCFALPGDPKEIIVNMARDWHADLILMGSHGRTGMQKLLLGSVSSSVSKNAPCSVEVVKLGKSTTPIPGSS